MTQAIARDVVMPSELVELCAALAAGPNDTVATLADRIYREFYCGLSAATPGASVSALEALRSANPMQARWEQHWLVERVDTQRSVAELVRGEERREAPLAQIAVGGVVAGGLPAAGTAVAVFVPHEQYFNDGAFYFVIGRTPHPPESGRQVRLYWNIDADGAPALAHELAAELERRRIPFWFKAPVTVAGYNRCDAGVLYMTDADLYAASGAIARAYRTVAAHLSKQTPLFTQAIAPGLAFAESPPTGDSFGVHRATHCAHGLLEARDRHAESALERTRIVAEHLAAYGLRLDALHLNPASYYPHPLDAIRSEIDR